MHSFSERSLAGPADHGAVGERVREREAQLDDVRATFDGGLDELGRAPATHQVDDERLHA